MASFSFSPPPIGTNRALALASCLAPLLGRQISLRRFGIDTLISSITIWISTIGPCLFYWSTLTFMPILLSCVDISIYVIVSIDTWSYLHTRMVALVMDSRSSITWIEKFYVLLYQHKEDKLANGSQRITKINANSKNLWTNGGIKQVMKHVIASRNDASLSSVN